MKPGRNDPCICGSGKKFKHCCEGKVAKGVATPTAAELNQLIALYNNKQYTEVENRSVVLVKRYPLSGFAWKLLGAALQRQGKHALIAMQKTAELMSGDAEAHFNLGLVQKNIGLLDESIASYRRALKIKPGYAEAHNNLGAALFESGKVQEAINSYRNAVANNPDHAQAHNNLGAALFEAGQVDEALQSYQRAVALQPNFAEAHNNLGRCLQYQCKFGEAESAYNQALILNPANFKAHGNWGNLLKDIGRLEEAVASYRKALELKPDLAEALSNLILALNYLPESTPESCLAQAKHYGSIVKQKVVTKFTSWKCSPLPERLRVGLVSGDLRQHSVGYFLVDLLSHIDPNRIELIAFPTQPNEDALTVRIRPVFSKWISLFGKSDQEASRLIHEQGVHILLDVSGHTAFNRLPVFAWKPAPVELSWLGFPHTSGVQEMDYVLGDLQAIPLDHEHHFTEAVWRMPDSYVCFSAPSDPIEVAALPASSCGYITFGSFNNLTKMNNSVVDLWSRVLQAVPNARLYLKTSQLGDADVRKLTLQRFAARGIGSERLLLAGKLGSIQDHLAEYNKVDIALDTFPYPGVTTSIEALWMGVPVLTLLGDRFLGLSAKSVAVHAGLPDWVAADPDEFVAKAVLFTSDLQQMVTLRSGLRERVLASPLFDAPRFARHLEQALWDMWQARGLPRLAENGSADGE